VPVGSIVTVGVLIWVVLAPALSARAVTAAVRQADAGDLRAAAASARRAQGLNPLSPVPLYTRADLAARSGARATADAFYLKATRLQPENSATWYELGLFRFLTDDLCGAYYALNAAYTLDPKSSLFYEGSELDRARDAVNDTTNPACGR
jgi:Flp pilus assembly protein TadD